MSRTLYGQDLRLGRLRSHVGDLRQLASVRRIALDDGPERGVRALAFSTGGGLDFWVLTDRSFDIGPLWFRGTPIAWQGANGFRGPALHDAGDDGGYGFTRSFSGLLVTCGMDHVRQPGDGRPLHGRLPFTPGRLLAYGEDWRRDEPVLFCEGEITQARFGGEALRLRRRIEAPIGTTELRIMDEVENLSGQEQPHEMLYHFNLGFPAINEGTRIRLGNDLLAGPLSAPCKAAEAVVACHEVGERHANCTIVTPLPDARDELRISIGFDRNTLPFLQLWQDLAPHRYIIGIEPCTSDRNPDGTSRSAPGIAEAGWSSSISFSVDSQCGTGSA